MNYRISPLWWPVMALSSPVLIPALTLKHKRFRANLARARQENQERIRTAAPLAVPVLETLEVLVLLDDRSGPGFTPAPGISYLLTTDQGSLLFDLGYGDEASCLAGNIAQAAPDFSGVQGVVISHLHPDHMGGFAACKARQVPLPKGCEPLETLPCYLPDQAGSDLFQVRQVDGPGLLPAGIGTTGPLERSLFFMGPTKEQALLVRLRDRGTVVITGCGHPTIAKILDYTRALIDDPVYAVIGGLHLPVTDSPLKKPGLKVQQIWGTGKPPWQRITDRDVDQAILALNRAGVAHLYLSTHDICAHAVDRLTKETDAKVCCLEAGALYRL